LNFENNNKKKSNINLNEEPNWIIQLRNNDKTLTSLDLNNQNISSENMIKLTKLLEKNNTLTKLNLKNTGIDDKTIENIADMLAINKTITSLELIGNKFDNG
jgi:hypothetical protein